jgi:DNA-binding transcriptional LysR family regulator
MLDFRLLRHLWYFLAVAEERHFGRAAKRIGITQPPLTQQIHVLEHVLGVELFERSNMGVRLTFEGQSILPAVQRFADQAARLQMAVQHARVGRSTSIFIGAITTALFNPLPAILAEMRTQHPDLAASLIEMDSVPALDAIEAGDIDIAFVRADQASPPIKLMPLTTDRLVVAIPVSHPLAGQDVIELRQLAMEPMVLFPRRISTIYYDSIISACRQAGFSPRILHEVRSVMSQVAFVACAVGIALVPAEFERLNTPGVVFRPLAEPIDIVTTAIAWNAQRASKTVLAVIDIAVAIAGLQLPAATGVQTAPSATQD